MASRRVLLTTLTLRSCRAGRAGTRRAGATSPAPRAEEDYIESTTNALVKRFKRCHRKKQPRWAEGVVLVEGRASSPKCWRAATTSKRCSSRTT